MPFGISQPLLEPDHGFTTGGNGNAGLDDSGMDGADRNLVQAIAFHRQKSVGRCLRQRVDAVSQREAYTPPIVIKPRTGMGEPSGVRPNRSWARAPIEALAGGACRSKHNCDRGNPGDGRDFCASFIHDRHMYRRGFAPKAEQGETSLCQLVCDKSPKVRTDHGSRPWPTLQDLATLQYAIDQRWHILLISKLSKKASHMWNQVTTARKIYSRDQYQ